MITEEKINNTPALSLPLTGRHLIEASAGTGKTWTLTGVVLRLIVEAGYPCEKIIATTFTKSASADMKQRIRERLQSFYHLLLMILEHDWQFENSLSDFNKDDDTPSTNAKKQQKFDEFWQQLSELAIQKQQQSHFEDKVNQYLLLKIAKKIFGLEVGEKLDFSTAKQRTQRALNQLDKLFVGTLDSLCQKWLKEFASDTGYTDIRISKDYTKQVGDMVHDQYRAFLAYLENRYRTLPMLYDTIQNKLHDPVDYEKVVERALNFYTAQIDAMPEPELNFQFADFENLIERIVNFNDSEFEKYFDIDYRKSVGMNGNTTLYKKFYLVQNMIAKMKILNKNQIFSWLLAGDDTIDFLQNIADCVENGKGFNANQKAKANYEIFINFAIMKDLYALYQIRQHIFHYIGQLNAFFAQHIAQYVRHNLAKVLEKDGLTTFSLQLARLNQSLTGSQGENLVNHIRHAYPIALIDESQDINTEQALLIERLYLQDNSGRINTHKGFLLLVGDPKQAIYGFRGGDVYNYTTLKGLFPQKPYQLTENFRSSKDLIDSINQWYGVENVSDNIDENHPSVLGEGIFYHKISASREEALLTDQSKHKNLPTIYQLKADYKQAITDDEQTNEQDDKAIDTVDFADIVTAQICLWFDKDNDEQLFFCKTLDNGEKQTQPLSLSDICILATKNVYLDKIEKQLNLHGIHTLRGGSQSIFADSMSQDILSLMAVLLQPYHQQKLRTLLLSSFFQMNLDEMNDLFSDMEKSAKFLDKIQQILIKAGEKWQQQSFLVAVQWLFQQKLDDNDTTIWQKLASHEKGERWLIDVRHLLDIINEYINHQNDKVGGYQLFDWFFEQVQEKPKDDQFLQHRLTSETGVQLMTIHQSKGLEFPIVFVVGLTDNLQKLSDPYLYLYTHSINNSRALLNRRLSPVANLSDTDFEQIEMNELYQEKLRLLYVALTRAKERVYVVTVGQYNHHTTSPLRPFVKMIENPKKEPQADLKNFELDTRLDRVEVVNTANQNSLSNKIQFLQNNPKFKLDIEQLINENNQKILNYQDYIANIQHKKFKGVGHTSFSTLLNFTSHQITQNEQDYDDVDNVLITSPSKNEQLPIRFTFEKGTGAGTFLHKVLEELTSYQDKNQQQLQIFDSQSLPKRWSIIIDRALRQQQLPTKYYSSLSASETIYQKSQILDEALQSEHLALANWLNEILYTPLQASGMRLIDIQPNHKLAEMGFNLSLSQQLVLNELNSLFAEHGIELNLQEKHKDEIWQYLKGEIDLVYQSQNCYYIVDYKSNFLGERFDDYTPKYLKNAMDIHHYWLQASIYQVALHRFLKLRLKNYDIYQHLGKVEYAFIRGMSPNMVGCGSMVWQIPVELVLSLDKLFGAKNEQ